MLTRVATSRRLAGCGLQSLSRARWSFLGRCLSNDAPADRGRRAAPDSRPLGVERGQSHDDGLLRAVFDQHAQINGGAKGGPSVGLFGNRYLTRLDGFNTFAEHTLQQCERTVDRVRWAGSEAELRSVVRLLDRLSDLLCRLLDACDFVRWAHPNPAWCRAAAAAWARVYQYMNQLNTSTDLFHQLDRAIGCAAIWASWSEEERAVALLLRHDFTRSAIHLPAQSRSRFVDLSQRISESGAAFLSGMRPETTDLRATAADLAGLPGLQHPAHHPVLVPSSGQLAVDVLRHVHSERTRHAVYVASRTAGATTVSVLEELLRMRADLATLAGFESYGHMTLKNRMMAESPAAVMQFLLALRDQTEPALRAEMAELQSAKQRLVHDRLGIAAAPDQVLVNAWDKEYLMQQVRQAIRDSEHDSADQTSLDDYRQPGDDDANGPNGANGSERERSPYLSVGTVMQGLSRLFSQLFGVRLVPVATGRGEVWHNDVRRLDVVAHTGRVAVLYCDLFSRPGKSPNPAHCTIRCSRLISEEEVHEAATAGRNDELDPAPPTFDSPDAAANDGMATARSDGALWQLPTIVLTCDFSAPPVRPGRDRDPLAPPALLAFAEVETLFHEMGHALHSILARTGLQNVSGTRCATDFSELPSTLLEHFATDPHALGLFARHWRTDAPLPVSLAARHARLSGHFDGLDTANQIALSVLDQVYHSPAAADRAFDSTALYHATLQRLPAGPPEPAAVRWQGFFGHLNGYGSTYYSYLFDRVLARRVWAVVFGSGRDAGALDPAAGHRLQENLLRWGGGRDPWRCLADTLRDDSIRRGGEQAMAVVGGWGLRSRLTA